MLERLKFFDALLDYLKEPTEDKIPQLSRLLCQSEENQKAYWRGEGYLKDRIGAKLAALVNQDRDAWAKFLFGLGDDLPEFKALSPFKDQMIILVDYGCGFVQFFGPDLTSLIDRIIESKNMLTYDADDYLVLLPEIKPEDCDVIWVNCGISGKDGPRPASSQRSEFVLDPDDFI